MKLNGTPRHYMPLSQNQSDEEESGPSKDDKHSTIIFKSSFAASTVLTKNTVQPQIVKINTKDLPMSPLRRLLFIMSLITCVLFVIIFVYFVPCSMSKTFDRTFHLTYKWKRIFHNMTFTSPLEFVSSRISGLSLIILGCDCGESNLIAIQENNGKEHWKLNFHSAPLSAICNILDLNLDGMPECLILGNKGLLAAVDVEKGSTLWYLHNHSDILDAHSIHEPTIVPDCDDDGILDIVISYSIDEESKNSYLAFVSGATGQIIGTLLDLPQCTGPVMKTFLWKLQNDSHLIIYCSENGNGNLWMLSSKEACDGALKVSSKFSLKNVFRIPLFSQDILFYKLSSSEDHLLIVLDGERLLLLEAFRETLLLKWKTQLEKKELRIITDGQFIKHCYQIILAANNEVSSQIVGVDIDSGKVTSLANVNQTVQGGVKLPSYFGDTDGLILKTTSFENSNQNEDSLISVKNLSESNEKDALKTNFKNETRILMENYLLLKCGKMSLTKVFLSEKILITCKSTNCHHNIYSKGLSVIVKKTDPGNSFDVMTVTSTMIPSNTSSEEMIMNYFNLKKFSTWSTCSN